MRNCGHTYAQQGEKAATASSIESGQTVHPAEGIFRAAHLDIGNILPDLVGDGTRGKLDVKIVRGKACDRGHDSGGTTGEDLSDRAILNAFD